MDYTDIIIPIITGAVSLLVCLINNHFQNSRNTAIVSYRLEQLEKKVDKHNNLVERMYRVEDLTNLQDAEIKRHNERIKILETHREDDLK